MNLSKVKMKFLCFLFLEILKSMQQSHTPRHKFIEVATKLTTSGVHEERTFFFVNDYFPT
jgi:hypothetical protein